jgi:dihydrofolate reductase
VGGWLATRSRAPLRKLARSSSVWERRIAIIATADDDRQCLPSITLRRTISWSDRMRKLKIIEYLTLDGVMEDPGPAGDFKYRGWTVPYWNDELAAEQSKELFESDALLLGRVTYEEFVAAWPLRSGDPFTDKMNSMKKFVASRNPARPLEWNATLLRGDVVEAVKRLKHESGEDVLIYGSSTLVDSLMQHGLIDQYRFIVYPLILGEGRRFFTDSGQRLDLQPVGATTTQKGVTLLTYARN